MAPPAIEHKGKANPREPEWADQQTVPAGWGMRRATQSLARGPSRGWETHGGSSQRRGGGRIKSILGPSIARRGLGVRRQARGVRGARAGVGGVRPSLRNRLEVPIKSGGGRSQNVAQAQDAAHQEAEQQSARAARRHDGRDEPLQHLRHQPQHALAAGAADHQLVHQRRRRGRGAEARRGAVAGRGKVDGEAHGQRDAGALGGGGGGRRGPPVVVAAAAAAAAAAQPQDGGLRRQRQAVALEGRPRLELRQVCRARESRRPAARRRPGQRAHEPAQRDAQLAAVHQACGREPAAAGEQGEGDIDRRDAPARVQSLDPQHRLQRRRCRARGVSDALPGVRRDVRQPRARERSGDGSCSQQRQGEPREVQPRGFGQPERGPLRLDAHCLVRRN
ncbi:hypothetical protein Rsub_01296 [Raphidocelis subcapitata]|uniref:Uncharacterized protein n=1 Tax=Raphidocelis subcapitata TaxID=307507 RepID=A0A2V0NM76_9CHLO|nr:hypothetical protein Rsub_01296 [Raphidocelis subcapitata]|eukprot:GBF88581.1 hypothetical protein Rsub_01296 [Raphidocelis subcapitata]